jgi:hypothetical protein
MSYPNYDHHRAFADIAAERRRQDVKWGPQHHSDGTNARYERDADHYKAVVDEEAGDGKSNWAHILLEEIFEALAETDPVRLRAELVESAAVIVNWIEDIDSRAAASRSSTVGEAIIALVPGAEGAGVKP